MTEFIIFLLIPSLSKDEVSAYTTLSQSPKAFGNGDTLDVWILDSVAGDRNLSRMHLLPKLL